MHVGCDRVMAIMHACRFKLLTTAQQEGGQGTVCMATDLQSRAHADSDSDATDSSSLQDLPTPAQGGRPASCQARLVALCCATSVAVVLSV